MNEIFQNLYEMTAFSNIIAEPQFLIMYAIAFILLYLGIKKQYEPLLLVPIAFGVLLANFPGGDMGVIQADENGMINVHGVMKNIWEMPLHDIAHELGLMNFIYYMLIKTGFLPPIIFMGVGALTDFGPMLRNLRLSIFGAAAQLGIFTVLLVAILMGFTPKEAASLGIIGGADGPTAIFTTIKLAPHLLGPIAIAAYSYMALVPVIIPLVVKLLCSKKELSINMKEQEKKYPSTTEIKNLRVLKIIFPIVVTTVVALFVQKLKQSGNLLLSIINNVLDMAKIESGKMEINENYGRLGAIRQSLFEIFEDEAKKKNLALHYTINVEHEHILTDTTKVKEIFVNILGNAIKYTPPGGSVIMSVEELPCNEPGYIIVRNRVSDTGIGMSEDFLTEIFEAFTREQNTTKSKIAGTGLGMSIVKKYVDLLGGTIEVESELGKGSTFTVTLKHKIADESYYVKKHLEESGISREILKDRSILLAEDNDLNAEIAAVILERAGLKVERVEDGLQCISRITEMPAGTYDIILMDIQMPKMDGYKATQTIRNLSDQEKACIPIIAMTANAFEEDKRAAIAAGMNGHIAKPIQVDKLLSILAEMIRQQEN